MTKHLVPSCIWPGRVSWGFAVGIPQQRRAKSGCTKLGLRRSGLPASSIPAESHLAVVWLSSTEGLATQDIEIRLRVVSLAGVLVWAPAKPVRSAVLRWLGAATNIARSGSTKYKDHSARHLGKAFMLGILALKDPVK